MTYPMPPLHLARALARADDVRAAAWAVVEHLEVPGARPSVFIERGGRLRCQALSGYRQLLDGVPPWAGVVGRTYATGEPCVVEDVRDHAHYLGVAEGVRSEACFPLIVRGRTIGVVNVEFSEPFVDGALEDVAATTAALADRIRALGGPPAESASQRLVRHAIALATQHDTAAIERAVVAAAVDITPLSSAMLLCRGGRGEPFTPSEVRGPLEPVLEQTPPEAIESLAAVAGAGCSIYTVAQPGGLAPQHDTFGLEGLRAAGAASLAVLAAGPDRILVVAGEQATGLSTEHCELLELLAAQASACLRTAASVTALRAQAATDALTGLGHHATFHVELAEARAAGNVGVLMVDVDGFKHFNDRHGHPAGDRALQTVAEALQSGLRRGDALFRIGGDEFAAILPGVDGGRALEVGRRLHAAVAAAAVELTVSIGAAAATEDEHESEVLGRADRALYTVKEHGRDGVALDTPAHARRRSPATAR